MSALGSREQFQPHRHPLLTPGRIKLVAMAILAVPAAALVLLGLAEMAGGDLSGAQHFLQAAPLVAALLIARRHPGVAGFALVVIGLLLFAAWILLVTAADTSDDTALEAWVAAGLLLFAPPIVAGLLLLKSAQ